MNRPGQTWHAVPARQTGYIQEIDTAELLAFAGESPDLRDLCANEATDVRAAAAVELFCYQAKKWIGSFAAALGGWTHWSSQRESVKTRP